jgi:hypothetical protein
MHSNRAEPKDEFPSAAQAARIAERESDFPLVRLLRDRLGNRRINPDLDAETAWRLI